MTRPTIDITVTPGVFDFTRTSASIGLPNAAILQEDTLRLDVTEEMLQDDRSREVVVSILGNTPGLAARLEAAQPGDARNIYKGGFSVIFRRSQIAPQEINHPLENAIRVRGLLEVG
ncbi:hypothetical protein [Tranquillimonas alkanivorans]|uniref:Uncharacterized protein n=1 Tax=Tranquillimonas alkanivorans TaxID=441119 RepID=A0A1I5TUV1_9RHOB|nr:hypothetical protein [Tranquillimonas alkanivorans]SFP86778.1 hypothetical protein SAMN04488047_11538 [Tranquillimonas alkanivorans]